MNAKALIMIGLVAGSALGGYVPALWGAGGFSMASVVLSGVGGLAGIWAGYKISRMGA